MNKGVICLFLFFITLTGWAEDKIVSGLLITGIEQQEDDEEAPFDIYARNKAHKCGGKVSNIFRVYSEYDTVANRRFMLALTAMKENWSISVSTHGCEGKALIVNSLRLEH